MPNVSKRGLEMPPSPIRKLVPYAEIAKEKGVKVFHLNIGQPDIETPKEMLDAVKNSDIKILEYSHSAGFLSYRQKLCVYYKRFGIELSPDDIIITTGGSEGILFAMMSCLDPEDEIIIPEPFYANYNGYAVAARIKIVPISSTIEENYKLPSIEEFEKSITPKTKAIMLCNPNNPTGYLYSQEEMRVLKELCLKHNLFLLADEAYREFCYDGAKAFSALELENMDQHVILLDTISKRYSACGARIGAFVSKNKEIMNTALRFAQARLSPPTLEQIAAEAATDLPETYFDNVIEQYRLRRNYLVERLNKMPGVICPNPGGAFYAMAKLPIDNADKFCQWLLEKFSYRNETIMMAPANGFYSTLGAGLQEVRFAYVLKIEDIERAMDCLEKGIEEYQKTQM